MICIPNTAEMQLFVCALKVPRGEDFYQLMNLWLLGFKVAHARTCKNVLLQPTVPDSLQARLVQYTVRTRTVFVFNGGNLRNKPKTKSQGFYDIRFIP